MCSVTVSDGMFQPQGKWFKSQVRCKIIHSIIVMWKYITNSNMWYSDNILKWVRIPLLPHPNSHNMKYGHSYIWQWENFHSLKFVDWIKMHPGGQFNLKKKIWNIFFVLKRFVKTDSIFELYARNNSYYWLWANSRLYYFNPNLI